MKKPFVMAVFVALGALVIGGGFFAWQKHQDDVKSQQEAAKQAQERAKYFEINDEAAGVYFRVGKSFKRLTPAELQAKNPSFLYGFASESDKSVYCAVSQTKRTKGGGVKFSDIEQGVVDQLKKSAPDISVEDKMVVEVGEGNKGARLDMGYKAGEVPMLQWEVIGLTDASTTFAFCNFPKAVQDLYREDAELFLGNLRIR